MAGAAAVADGKVTHGEIVSTTLLAGTASRTTTLSKAGAIGLAAELVKIGIDYAVSQPPYNGKMIYEIEYDPNTRNTKNVKEKDGNNYDGTNY
ncbi:hypothetical protein [Neisseria yangbaofengii]|uniref:hypothetical protein n=1 Tax=Neisseria yangbaofengii TaxID=2709396 RepID=UPI0013ECC400|nr:hypothetical protein [Neisseria yangbaofengii]